MDKRGFYARVRELTGFDQSDAEFLTQASITALGRVLAQDEAGDLASALPEGLSDFVEPVADVDRSKWSANEFWRQVSARCAISDPRKVRRGFWATIDALRETAGDERVERWTAALPKGISRETETR
jgi:uncharacterized protein (DUF2267 family)